MRTTKRLAKRGASLIELLVVVTILALLFGIMLPAMSRSRSESQKLACINNQRQIMTVALEYSMADRHSILGPVHPLADQFTGEGISEYGGGPGTSPFTGWRQQFGPRTRPLNKIMYGDASFPIETEPGNAGVFKEYRCPGKDLGLQRIGFFLPHEVERPYFESNGTSYRMNNLNFSFSDTSLGIYARSHTAIPDTGSTIAFMEARAFQTLFTNDVNGTIGPLELTSYHDLLGHFVLSYADGHAAFVDMGNGTYYPARQQYNLMDRRGTWGQFDTFPEPPVPLQ